MADHEHFPKGALVEVSNEEEGFRGSWYAATVIKPPPSTSISPNPKRLRTNSNSKTSKVTIEYQALMADETGSKRLQETIDTVLIRPFPPRETVRKFNFSEEVDALYNEGWWEGVVTEVLEDSKYAVFFRRTREQLVFKESDLRLHREWVNGKWVPPLENQKVPSKAIVRSNKSATKEKYTKGSLVEVSSDEEGFQGAWFPATVIKQAGKDKYLIQYQSLRNDDDTDFMKEEFDILHIRPHPPETVVVDRFNRFEEVDALYNDGWWVGIISKVLSQSKYNVFFRGTDEELAFAHSDLRLHQDWIDGGWVIPSRALNL